MSEKCACARLQAKIDEALRTEPLEYEQSGCYGHALEYQIEYIRVHDDCSCRANEEEQEAKCACERAKAEIDELIHNPISKEVGSGRLRDAMEAEDNYFRIREHCSCRVKANLNDSLLTQFDSDEEGEVDDERDVEEEEDEEPARGEKRPRSDDDEEEDEVQSAFSSGRGVSAYVSLVQFR